MIYVERRFLALGALAAVFIILVVTIRAGAVVNTSLPSLPLSQIARSWTDLNSIDENGNGLIDVNAVEQGPGSGFDADTVDGYHASDLLAAASSALKVCLYFNDSSASDDINRQQVEACIDQGVAYVCCQYTTAQTKVICVHVGALSYEPTVDGNVLTVRDPNGYIQILPDSTTVEGNCNGVSSTALYWIYTYGLNMGFFG